MPYSGRTLIRIVRNSTDFRRHLPKNPLTTLGDTTDFRELLSKPTWSVRSLLPPRQPADASTAATTTDSTTTATTATTSSSADGETQPTPSSTTSTTPTPDPNPQEPTITPQTLHHLLRLSALPLPKTPAEETRLLSDLRAQIHFVKHLQSIPTSDVEPLVAIRDETAEAKQLATITMEDLRPYFELEERVGRNGTLRRRKTDVRRALEEEGKGDGEGEGDGEGDEKIFKWTKLKASGEEEGRRWSGYYVVRRGRKGRAVGGGGDGGGG